MEIKVDIGCPRCNGDLHVFSDLYGKYEQCIHCGYTNDLREPKIIMAPKKGRELKSDEISNH